MELWKNWPFVGPQRGGPKAEGDSGVDPIYLPEDFFFLIFHCLRFVPTNSIRLIRALVTRLHHHALATSTMGAHRGFRRFRGCPSRRPPPPQLPPPPPLLPVAALLPLAVPWLPVAGPRCCRHAPAPAAAPEAARRCRRAPAAARPPPSPTHLPAPPAACCQDVDLENVDLCFDNC